MQSANFKIRPLIYRISVSGKLTTRPFIYRISVSGKLTTHLKSLASVTFYFTDESEPSLVSSHRSRFILPSCQNRHRTHRASYFLCINIIPPMSSKLKLEGTSPSIKTIFYRLRNLLLKRFLQAS